MVWLVVWASLAQHVLPGLAKPVFAFENETEVWVLRQREGEKPELWRLSPARPVAVPDRVRFLVPHERDGMFYGVTDRRLFLGAVRGDALAEQRLLLSFEALPEAHFWVPAQKFEGGSQSYLAFVNGGQLHLCTLNGTPRHDVVPLPSGDETLARGRLVQAVTNPRFLSSGESLFYMAGDRLFSLDLGSPQAFERVAGPEMKLRDMEKVVAVPGARALGWFVYGGQRGNFSSFGWRLLPAVDGKADGIVVKFGSDLRAPSRFLVFTVSNQALSQAWQALTGKAAMDCSLLVNRAGRWARVNAFSLKTKKRAGRDFAISWATDWNRDGFSDLVVADGKRGIRVYQSKQDRSIAERPLSLGRTPAKLLFLKNRLLKCERRGDHWVIEVAESL